MGRLTDLGGAIITKFYSTTKLVISFIITYSGIAFILRKWSEPYNKMSSRGDQYLDWGRNRIKSDTKKFINDILEENESLKTELEESKNMWTETFGKKFERRAKHDFNNTSDPLPSTAISDSFRRIHEEEWRDAMGCFKDNEKKGIIVLSEVLQDCQTFCQEKAEKQLMMFINPCINGGQRDDTPQRSMTDQLIELTLSEEEIHNLYKIRRKIGQQQSILDSVKECFYDKYRNKEVIIEKQEDACCKDTGEDNERSEDNIGDIHPRETYIKKCTELCWQAAISDPPVYLQFDVNGVDFDEIKSKFTKYAGKIPIDKDDKLNHVKHVVWPAVVIKCSENDKVVGDGKGEVVISESSSIN